MQSLLIEIIKHHLNTLLKDKRVSLPEDTILKLRNSFYVDNWVTSVDTQEELREFIKNAAEIFAEDTNISIQIVQAK